MAVAVAVGVAVAVTVAVAVGVAVALAVGEGVGVGVGLGAVAQYLPPVFKGTRRRSPAQTIISLPVQTAVRYLRPRGALMLLVAVQLSVPGSYLPPGSAGPETPRPPQMIISLPVHTDASCARSTGALVKLVAIQQPRARKFYLPPVFNRPPMKSCPPQTIISLPVDTAVCQKRPAGALVVQVGVQLSVMGL